MSSSVNRFKNEEMTKASITPDGSLNNDRKKNSIIPKIFGSKWKNVRSADDHDIFGGRRDVRDIERRCATSRARLFNADPMIRKSFSERQTSSSIQGLNLCNFDRTMDNVAQIQDFRIFVATWNVGGRSPNNGLNLEDFLQAEGSSDIYVLGFQEIVPLNAGNVLVIEDNEPAAKWLALISQALNRPTDPNRDNDFSVSSANSESNSAQSSKDSKAPSSSSGLLFFQKPSLKILSRNFRVDGLKTCNCNSESPLQQRGSRELGEQTKATATVWDDCSEDDTASYFSAASEFPSQNHLGYLKRSGAQAPKSDGVYSCDPSTRGDGAADLKRAENAIATEALRERHKTKP